MAISSARCKANRNFNNSKIASLNYDNAQRKLKTGYFGKRAMSNNADMKCELASHSKINCDELNQMSIDESLKEYQQSGFAKQIQSYKGNQ